MGTLTIGVSFSEVWSNLQSQIITIALTNFARTLVVALLILIIFDRVAGRHLRYIADQVVIVPWLTA